MNKITLPVTQGLNRALTWVFQGRYQYQFLRIELPVAGQTLLCRLFYQRRNKVWTQYSVYIFFLNVMFSWQKTKDYLHKYIHSTFTCYVLNILLTRVLYV